MLTLAIIFIVISSGSFFASTFFDKKYEEALPLTFFAIIFSLYLFGICGALKAGVLYIIIMTLFLLIVSIVNLVHKKRYRQMFINTITPGFVCFVIFYLVISICNYHRVAYSWDEFSHWADIVKAMFSIDDFGTNPSAYSTFRSYPPAMALFQYFTQVVNREFNDWLLYFSYQILSIGLFIPFLKNAKFTNFGKLFLAFVSILFIPVIFINDFYNAVYIDGFLGLLFGASLGYIYVNRKYDLMNSILIIFSIIILALTKDAGLFLAFIVLIVFSLDLVLFQAPITIKFGKIRFFSGKRSNIIMAGIALVSLLFVQLSWQFQINRNNVIKQFSSKYDLAEFARVFTDKFVNYRNITDYKKFVLDGFINQMQVEFIKLGPITFSPIHIFIILFVLIYIVNSLNRSAYIDDDRRHNTIISICTLGTIVYVLGLLLSYMFKFTEYEAIRLASFGRYLGIILSSTISLIMIISLSIYFSGNRRNNTYVALILSFILLVTPYAQIKSFLLRENVYLSISSRSTYDLLSNEILENIDDDRAKIYLLSQENSGYDYWAFRYALRPHIIDNALMWSIGEPFYEGDIWTHKIGIEDLKRLLADEYDYFYIYYYNSYFVENYSLMFANPNEIIQHQLYKVDKASGQLSIVD